MTIRNFLARPLARRDDGGRVASAFMPAAYSLKYRPDIDGMRAVAVMSVVLFHAYPSLVPGGFVGVDVFYVISGYLITQILLSDLQHKSFSILKFYERRIRRIFPALFFMLAASTAATLFVFAPADLIAYAHSLVAATLFSSNFLFWREAGYFDTAVALKPLLHTWSLAIEEQFYIFFPLLLFVVWRLGHPRFLIWVGLIASLALSVVVTPIKPDASFYLIPTRAWELMTGAVLVFGTVPGTNRAWIRELMAAVGLFLILLSLFVICEETLFPGYMALLPCGGAAMLIYAGIDGGPTIVSRLLSLKPVVFVGLISYSLYLWHWPALAFARYVNLDPLSTFQATVVVLVAGAMASFSWRFVERPFRRGHQAIPNPLIHRFVKSRLRVIATGLAVMAVFVSSGIAIGAAMGNKSLVARIYGKDIAAVNAVAVQNFTPYRCRSTVASAMRHDCLLGDRNKPATVAMWGDSVADTLSPAFADIDPGHSAYGFFFLSCPSILGAVRIDDRPAYRGFGAICKHYNRNVFNMLKHLRAVTLVVLTGNYGGDLDEQRKNVYLMPDGYRGGNSAQRSAMIADRIIDTVKRLRAIGKTVAVLGAYYTATNLGAQYELRALMRDPDARRHMRIDAAIFDAHTRLLNDRLRALNDPGVIFVDPRTLFCPDAAASGTCDYDQGLPLTVDGTHFTRWGAHVIAQGIRKAIESNLSPKTGVP